MLCRVYARSLLLALVVVGLAGCGGKRDFGGAHQAYPVTGIVTVDGEPLAGIKVRAVLVDQAKKSAAANKQSYMKFARGVAATTEKDGHFSFSTFVKGDGLAAGDYTLTFLWVLPEDLNDLDAGDQPEYMQRHREEAADKFKGRYKDAAKSEVKFTVGPDNPKVDLGTIDLKSTAAKK